MGNIIKKYCFLLLCVKTNNQLTEPLNHKNSQKSYIKEVNLQDFKIIKTLGKGSFGKVLMVQNKESKNYYAMKVLKKELLKSTNQIAHTKTERQILEIINHPFIVKLYYAFQTSEKLYIVTEFMQGGELFFHLRKEGWFNDNKVKFYICEIILALEHLHKNKIIYRDLKPENILLDKSGHIKLADFGLSKIIEDYDLHGRAYTICGTPEYLAPEILVGNGYNKNVDWWSLGAVMYEMFVGFSPYKENKYKLDIETYYKPIPHHKNISLKAYDLINKLLNIDSNKRLGHKKDAEDIKRHDYFKGVNWKNIIDKKIKPPYKPYVKNDCDLNNFDRLFTDEDPNSSKGSLFPTFNKNDNYENFSYVRNEI